MTTNVKFELPRTSLGREILADPQAALEREWLVTNGIGGYACASLGGASTRRYHALLAAALQPPLGRTILLSKLEEEASLGETSFNLTVNEWKDGGATLDGLAYLDRFEQEGTLPGFVYRLGEATLTKSVWMEYGFNTTYIRYSYDGPAGAGPLGLRLRPLVNCRDYHGTTHSQQDWHYQAAPEPGIAQCWAVNAGSGAPVWRLFAFDQTVEWQPAVGQGWYWGFRYRQEEARGLEAEEDLYCIGTFRLRLEPGQSVTFAASTAMPDTVVRFYSGARERELARQQAVLEKALIPQTATTLETLASRLYLAADQFIVGRPDPAHCGQLLPDYRTVIAGYHWFGDWGRDTMISLPGLALVTGRYEEAATILRSFARFISKGMLPNRFPDNPQDLDESEYNTVDATLWYFDAVAKYLDASEDWELGRQLYPVLAGIVRWHLQGTRFNIKVAGDGLLASGAEGVQLTWMDAKIGDWVVTPRRGKPIEINALWYRACRVMENLAGRFGTADDVTLYAGLAARVAAIFERTYWSEAGGYFYDLINEFGNPDPVLRPNQVIALAVAPELVSLAKARAALGQVRRHLLTPFGLRTLSPADPGYHPTYGGGPYERDSAYHQGTIWPWLFGPLGRVIMNLEGPDELRALLRPFARHLNEAGIGQVNEIFGAEAPYPPVGCIAQAWSVAQLLEAWQLLQG